MAVGGNGFEGFMTDFQSSGGSMEPYRGSSPLNAPGTLHRVGGSFDTDSVYDIIPGNPNGEPATQATGWTLQTQAQRIGGGLA